MIARIGKLVGYTKAPRATYMLRHPIKGLRWTFSHADQVTEAQLERMKKLGMSVQLHSRPPIQGVLMHKVHGEKAWDMPPFRRVEQELATVRAVTSILAPGRREAS
jgi:predicted amidohydrolase YtcJ